MMRIGALTIEVRPEHGQYVALENVTGMFGEGDSADDALSNLVESLYDHKRDLEEHRPRLSEHLSTQLRALARSLPRREET